MAIAMFVLAILVIISFVTGLIEAANSGDVEFFFGLTTLLSVTLAILAIVNFGVS